MGRRALSIRELFGHWLEGWFAFPAGVAGASTSHASSRKYGDASMPGLLPEP